MSKKTNTLAVLSLVMSICGLSQIMPIAGSLAAIIMGHIARAQIANDPTQDGDGWALSGLIIGYCGMFLTCTGILAFVAVYGAIAVIAVFAVIMGA